MIGSGRVVGIVLVVMLLSAGVALAAPPQQGATRLNYDTTVQGTITDAQYFLPYEFQGRAGDVVVIEMTTVSGDLDPFVGLFDPGENLLVSNDDISSSNRNSRIEPFTLPEDGTYQIIATRYNLEEGLTTGTFALTLTLVSPGGGSGGTGENQPTLSVPYRPIGLSDTVSGTLAEGETQYYLLSGEAGDVVIATMRPDGSGVIPHVLFYSTDLTELSDSAPRDDGSAEAYFVLPMPGWYLIGVSSQGGGGAYTLETSSFPAQIISYGSTLSGQVTDDAPNNWYVFEAQQGDTVTVRMSAESGDLVPYIILADINLNDLAYSTVGQNPATLTYAITQSGSYVILAGREGLSDGTTTGTFSLELNGTPLDPATLEITPLGYGRSVQGTISDETPRLYYSFQGKRGDLVTIQMNAFDANALDAYLSLTDESFNELIASDDVGNSRDARIFQYQLPDDGLYYIIATRAGPGSGGFTLQLTAGEVELTTGALEATLRWNHTGDVDLLVQDPNGDYVAWDSPQSPSGGILEVDTNGNCESVTSLPVEHAYWPEGTNLPGVYRFFVWYQLDCDNRGPVTFDLSVVVGGEEIARVSDQLERGQRYEMSITVNPDGTAQSNNDGRIVTPDVRGDSSDIPIAYGDTVTGMISDEQYIVYYTFAGEAGDTVVVTVDRSSGNLDPYTGLIDAAGNVLIEDDDSGGDRNARLTYTLPQTGDYRIAVTRYQIENGETSGGYRLSLTTQR